MILTDNETKVDLLNNEAIPEETFTVKDRFGLDSERDGLNPALGSYRQFHRQPVLLAGDSYR